MHKQDIKEKQREYSKKYYILNKEKKNEKYKEYRQLNKEDLKQKSKQRYIQNKEARKLAKKAYLLTEKGQETQRKANSKWSAKKRATDPNFKLRLQIRNRMKNALKKHSKSGSAVKDLGCSIEEYRTYLESKFLPGMSWENHGVGYGKWHIDHIMPLSKMDLTDREQFLKACNYSNTQPMWSEDNVKKGNKTVYHNLMISWRTQRGNYLGSHSSRRRSHHHNWWVLAYYP